MTDKEKKELEDLRAQNAAQAAALEATTEKLAEREAELQAVNKSGDAPLIVTHAKKKYKLDAHVFYVPQTHGQKEGSPAVAALKKAVAQHLPGAKALNLIQLKEGAKDAEGKEVHPPLPELYKAALEYLVAVNYGLMTQI